MQRPPRILTWAVNRLVSSILHSPFRRLLDGRVLLLSLRGRKSGRTFTLPVNYRREGDVLFIHTRSVWSRNLRGGAPVTVFLRGRDRAGRATPQPPAFGGGAGKKGETVMIRIDLTPEG